VGSKTCNSHVGSGGKRRCSSAGNRAPGRILDVGVNTTKELPCHSTASESKSGPLRAPGHDQKKIGACVVIARALIQAFFVGSEGGVKIGEEYQRRGR
jgi:hypothetical protein